MKKLLNLVLTMGLALAMGGCQAQEANPQDTVTQFFDYARELNFTEMATLVQDGNLVALDQTEEMLNPTDEEDDYSQYFLDYLKSNAQKLEYEVVSSEIDDGRAVIVADCTYVNGGDILLATMQEYFVEALTQAFSGEELTDDEYSQMFIDIMDDQIAQHEEELLEATVTFDLVKVDGEWYIENISEEVVDVILSGFMSAASQLEDDFMQ